MNDTVTGRIEAAMEKYAPEGFDPASDDLTIPFAQQLVEKDEENARLRSALSALLVEYVAGRKDGNVNSFPATAQKVVRNAEAALTTGKQTP